MANSPVTKVELDRLWQQAGLYESQGLLAHARDVYKKILEIDPDNQNARSKLNGLLASENSHAASDLGTGELPELSPREALDLGIAYMEMDQYAEALDEFTKALKHNPALRVDMMRQSAICLLHLKRNDEARDIIDRIMTDRTLSNAEIAQTIVDMVDVYDKLNLTASAYALLKHIPLDCRSHVQNYESLMADLTSKIAEQELEIEVADEEAGFAYTTTTIGRPHPKERPVSKTDALVRSREGREEARVPLKARIVYSEDSRNWHEGVSSELSSKWTVIQTPEPVKVGVTLMLLVHLPLELADEPVWALSKVITTETQDDGSSLITAQFVSFPSGGDLILNEFIEKALEDPTILDHEIDVSTPPHLPDSTDLFKALEEQAISAFEHEVLPPMQDDITVPPEHVLEAGDKTPAVSSANHESSVAPIGLEEELERAAQKAALVVKFACVCGQVHSVPRSTIGRTGRCTQCSREMKVPQITSSSDRTSDQILGTVIGGCRILYKIGGGGMGGVYKGHHLGLDIPVAVKVLHAHLAEKDSVFVKRFIREARASAKLQHPNIVGVMNVGFEDGLHYIVMQYLGGGSAATLQSAVGRLPLDRVIEIGIQVASALVLAEEHNILHRDIKPANILFTDKGEAKLADLGLAKTYLDPNDAGITQTGITCGTPLYFSPEQAKGSPNLDIRSDIYSLGISLYHLLEGNPPFMGESAYVIFQKHVHEELPPLKVHDPPIPDQVYQLLKKMTAKKPEDRFQSARELLDMLEALRDQLTSPDETTERKGLLNRLGITRSDP